MQNLWASTLVLFAIQEALHAAPSQSAINSWASICTKTFLGFENHSSFFLSQGGQLNDVVSFKLVMFWLLLTVQASSPLPLVCPLFSIQPTWISLLGHLPLVRANQIFDPGGGRKHNCVYPFKGWGWKAEPVQGWFDKIITLFHNCQHIMITTHHQQLFLSVFSAILRSEYTKK